MSSLITRTVWRTIPAVKHARKYFTELGPITFEEACEILADERDQRVYDALDEHNWELPEDVRKRCERWLSQAMRLDRYAMRKRIEAENALIAEIAAESSPPNIAQ